MTTVKLPQALRARRFVLRGCFLPVITRRSSRMRRQSPGSAAGISRGCVGRSQSNSAKRSEAIRIDAALAQRGQAKPDARA